MPMKLFIRRQPYFIIFTIGLFLAGCDMDNDSPPSQGKDNEKQINATLSSGSQLPNGTLQDKLLAIAQRTDKYVIYDIAIDNDASYSPLIVMTQGEYITVKIHSTSPAIHTLTLNTPGSLFTVGENATLMLENIILKGHPHNNRALISVKDGGTLIIMDGTIIRDNQNENRDTEGGGVYVDANSRLFMKGGEICYNYCGNRIKWDQGSGGGVYICGSFNMTGGTINNNEAERNGGGVCIDGSIVYGNGIFIMNGGEIAANQALYGGGLYLYGRFEKKPLPNNVKSGVIWGYPANGKENYANGATIFRPGPYSYNGTLGEYDYF
jgi:hypothetical protein